MDFIIDLLLSRDSEDIIFNSLFVVVDQYTKIIKYISILKTIIVERLSDVFIEYIVSKFEISKSIISDRGAVFISAFWL